MGCIAIQRKREQQLSPLDYRFIWAKCLSIQSIIIHTRINSFHPVFQQIDKDVDRTYPDVPQFNQPYVKQSFRKVLRTFALQFPKVGYTQGLNFVAGIFLISGFNQNQSTKCLMALCTNANLMLLGLFEDDFPLCRLYCQIFWIIIKMTNPQVYRIFKQSNIPDEMWIFQWFITLFTYTLPQSYLKEIFNFIIVKGQFAAVRIAIGMVQSLQKYFTIAQMKDQSLIQCLQYIKDEQFCNKYLPIHNIIKRAQKIKNYQVFQSLKECKINNYYKYYFICPLSFRQKKHQRFMQDLQIQRNKYQIDNGLSNNTRYSRQMSSIKIMEYIEQTKIKRYSRVMSRSSQDKQNPFFSNLTLKNYISEELTQQY